jgi:hypothetical protein
MASVLKTETQNGVEGSNPFSPLFVANKNASIAQLVERNVVGRLYMGSSPITRHFK